MRILFEITHPKHAHFFRNAIATLMQNGEEIAIMARDKDVTTSLLDAWGFEYRVLTQHTGGGILALGKELLVRNWKLWQIARRFRPDVIVARVGPSAAQVGFFVRRPVIVFEDVEDAILQQRISFPFATRICTSMHYEKDWGAKHIRYQSFDELAYLHPKCFTPDPELVRCSGLIPGEYIIVRFVSWHAAHDIGQSGLNPKNKLKILETLEGYGRVFVTSETPLPDEYERFRLPVPTEHFHHLLAYAKLTFGESPTVATEGAMLGVPGILIHSMNWGSVNRLADHYKLLFQTQSDDEALHAAKDLLSDSKLADKCRKRFDRLLDQESDLTDWMIDQIQCWGTKASRSTYTREPTYDP